MGKLVRSNDKVISGVCGGLAKEFGLDAKLVRILYAVITFFTGIVLGAVVYAILALILPVEGK
ncbi:MAG: PspC domain-containing protein [Bacteroidaceae bacterium]|nr:PspC domain-containing protein [Bacteroidaceae bacterium]MBQ8364543.1 PspC domain-containing protein [Bacteroidaceae bacterium]